MRFLTAFVFSLLMLPPVQAQWVRIDTPDLPRNGIFAVGSVVASEEAVHALAGTGPSRLYRSVDDGENWTVVASADAANALYGAEATVVAHQPGTALHVSVDGGLTWTTRAATAAPLDGYFAGMARVDRGGRAHAFLSNTNPNRLYLTRDDFTTVEPKLPSEAIGRVVSNGRIFVAANGSAGYFRSVDGGQTWTSAATPGLGSQYLYASRDSFFVSGVVPSSGARVLVASVDGAAWTQVATGAVLTAAPALASSARHSAVFTLGQAPSSQPRLYASVRSGRQPVNVTDGYPVSSGPVVLPCFPTGAFVAISSRYAYALAQCDQTGASVIHALYRRPIQGTVVAAAETPADAGFTIGTLAPQPARHTASLAATLLRPQSFSVHLYDVLGRQVAEVHEGLLGAGTHTLRIDVAPLPAGVYVVRASTGSHVVSRRLVVAR